MLIVIIIIIIEVSLLSVVQRLNNAIQWITVYKSYYSIGWIALYPVDSIVHASKKPGPE